MILDALRTEAEERALGPAGDEAFVSQVECADAAPVEHAALNAAAAAGAGVGIVGVQTMSAGGGSRRATWSARSAPR